MAGSRQPRIPAPGAGLDFGRDVCGTLATAEAREWLCTNGIGGFASGTVAGLLTRRYHGLLVAALKPPVGRTLLVTTLDLTARYGGQTYPLFANRRSDGVLDPHGYRHIERFFLDGTSPVWRFACVYHQGTVWGWLLGPFALAHLRVYGDRDAAPGFLEPMAYHLGDYGLGSIAEILDGDPPFAPRGCFAQPWSVAETLRAWCEINGPPSRTPPRARPRN